MTCRTAKRSALLVAWLALAAVTTAGGALPTFLEQARFDWVCVTTSDLVDAYRPLADHRRADGLTTLVVDLDDVLLWSPVAPDTTGSLRWLAGVAVDQWGARYLLIGGSHARLPAPIHRLATPYWNYDHPTDAYFACLGGDWDVNDNGLVAEYGVDAADPTVHLAVGRLPLDTAGEVANAVAKILAYERRPLPTTDTALFVASLMDPYWDGTGIYPNIALFTAMSLRDTALATRPSLSVETLFQGAEPVDPWFDPLNPTTLVDMLAARPRDLVHIQLMASDAAWQLAGTVLVRSADFDRLANVGHGFLVTMLTGGVADTREPSILAHLLGMPAGGAVGGVVTTGMGFLQPHATYYRELWPRLLDDSVVRLGDAHRDAAAAFLQAMPPSSAYLDSYWVLAMVGDPATRLQSSLADAGPPPEIGSDLALRAAPNPFNPSTRLDYRVPVSGRVRIDVHDARGRLVRRLRDRTETAGRHSCRWDGADDAGRRLTSGVYLVTLSSPGSKLTRRVVLLK